MIHSRAHTAQPEPRQPSVPEIPPLVSVVMLCWNRRDDVRESLTRIRECDYPNLEVIVADNASTDGTVEMVRGEFPEVRLLEHQANIGIEAYNAGFRAARGEHVVILDDDSFPAVDAISRMVSKFEADPQLGIVAFDVRNYFSYDEVADRSPAPPEDTATTESYPMGFNGAGAGVRRTVFERVGYYPAEFFLYWNEQDLALRVLDAGYSIRFFSDVVSYHKYSPANRASWRAPFYYCRNAYWLVWKNYPLGKAVALTLELGRRVVYHSLEQRTWIYLRATLAALIGMVRIARLRRPVRAELAQRFRAPVELSFTFFR